MDNSQNIMSKIDDQSIATHNLIVDAITDMQEWRSPPLAIDFSKKIVDYHTQTEHFYPSSRVSYTIMNYISKKPWGEDPNDRIIEDIATNKTIAEAIPAFEVLEHLAYLDFHDLTEGKLNHYRFYEKLSVIGSTFFEEIPLKELGTYRWLLGSSTTTHYGFIDLYKETFQGAGISYFYKSKGDQFNPIMALERNFVGKIFDGTVGIGTPFSTIKPRTEDAIRKIIIYSDVVYVDFWVEDFGLFLEKPAIITEASLLEAKVERIFLFCSE